MLTLRDEQGYPAYNATDVRDFMVLEGRHLFNQQDLHTAVKVFTVMGFTLFFFSVCYYIGKVIF